MMGCLGEEVVDGEGRRGRGRESEGRGKADGNGAPLFPGLGRDADLPVLGPSSELDRTPSAGLLLSVSWQCRVVLLHVLGKNKNSIVVDGRFYVLPPTFLRILHEVQLLYRGSKGSNRMELLQIETRTHESEKPPSPVITTRKR